MLSQALEILKEFFSKPIIFGIVTTLQIISAAVVAASGIGIFVFKRKHHKIVHDFKPVPPEE
jgi:hypothetical protein